MLPKMKLTSLFIVLFFISSCSKEVRVNNRLDGKWSLKIDKNEDSSASYLISRKYKFTKLGKNTGFVEIQTKSLNAGDYNDKGTYTITRNELRMILTDDIGVAFNLDYKVKSFLRRKIVLQSMHGDYEAVLISE
jgi:hypothetical protein